MITLVKEFSYQGETKHPLGKVYEDTDRGYFINITCWADESLADEFMELLSQEFQSLDGGGSFQKSDMDEQKPEAPSKIIAFKQALTKASEGLIERNKEGLSGFLNLSALLTFGSKTYLIHCGAPFVFLFQSKNQEPEILATISAIKSTESNDVFFPQNPIGYCQEINYQELVFDFNPGDSILFLSTKSIPSKFLQNLNPENWAKTLADLFPNRSFWACQVQKS